MNDNRIVNDYTQDCEALQNLSMAWDDRENLIVGNPADRLSQKANSKVSDGGLSTNSGTIKGGIDGVLITGRSSI